MPDLDSSLDQRSQQDHLKICSEILHLRQKLSIFFETKLFNDHNGNVKTSSYPGWIKSPHVVTLGILKLSDLDSLTIFNLGGGGIPE